MKKLLLGLVVILLVAVGYGYSQLDNIVKVGVETGGPKTLKVPVTVKSINLSPFSGKVSLTGLEIGQPDGFGEGQIASVGSFDMKIKPSSLMSDHIIVESIVIDAPMLDARRIDGKTNFEKLQQNVGPADTTEPTNITLTIKKMEIRAPKVAVKTEGALSVDKTIELANFTITDLGTDEKGMAPAEIARHVMSVLQPQIAEALIKAGASDKLKELVKDKGGSLEQGLTSLVGKLKKKKDDQN